MNKDQRIKLANTFEQVLLFIWGVTFLVFPLFFTTLTTDPFFLPKQALLGFVVLISLLIWGAKMVLEEKVRFRKTPFDIPVILLGVALILSSLFSVDRLDSLISLVPIIFAILAFFVVVNTVRKSQSLQFLFSCLLVGTLGSSLLTILGAAKIYLLPFASTHTQTFTTFGSYFEQTLYTLFVLPISAYFGWPILNKKTTGQTIGFAVLFLILLGNTLFMTTKLFTTQKPTILPFETGFQTAFAAISQDSGRVAQGFFFGTGYGNFSVDFTRFKQATFNTNQNLWFLSFTNSSSLILELLATTGLIGILAILFLYIKVLTPVSKKLKNPFYLSILIFAVISFILPLGFVEIALFFILLSLFALFEETKNPRDYLEIEIKFVALKKGIFSFVEATSHERKEEGALLMPAIVGLIILVIVGVLGYYSVTYVYSDSLFQQSQVAATQNSGAQTYQLQTQAINTFPYRSGYYQVFSQTNIALANSLLALTPKNSTPSAQAQQTAYTLIQQAITSAKTATTLSPESVVDWQNLASVYRSLIGIGQNADSFAISSTQQAVQLDPTNPQEFLALGGIYYQLGQYDNAIQEFQQAANLKQDYANAYYNLGHAYEQKQDTQNALANLEIVKQLVANDPSNEAKINSEIQALQSQGKTNQTSKNVAPSSGYQQPLNVNGAVTPVPTAIPTVQVAPPATSSGK